MFNHFATPKIMGILNVTPDSFSDGGDFTGNAAAINHVQLMLDQGVDIIDIGGESTRPGAKPVSAEEQIRRVIPVIESIRSHFSPEILLSIDTSLSVVANAALAAGADMINDVTAGLGDNDMLTVAAQEKAPVILMHMQGNPKTMQENPQYEDVVSEILNFLQQRIEAALAAGIASNHIAIDPGIGFGKRKQDNLDLLANLHRFVATGFPVLLGTSRKRFMGAICQVDEPADLVTATAVTTALGVKAGVQMFRVHDVKENRQAADIAWAIKKSVEK